MTVSSPSFGLPTDTLAKATAGRRAWPLLAAICLLLWLPGFFTLPPGDRDESRFAEATRQMIQTGDYVRIENGAVARDQKPIGIYWLQVPFVLAARAAGLARANPIWPYRMPSLLGGLLAVLATYGFGRRLVGTQAAFLAASFLAGSVILTVEVHIAKTDAALLGLTTIAMFLLARAYLEPTALGRRGALLFWAVLGGAILVKGPIAPMVCGLAAAWLAVADRARGWPRWLGALRPKQGVPLLLAIVLPWFIAIGVVTHGRFFAQSLDADLAGKIGHGEDAHGAPFGLHALLLPVLLFGGGIAVIAALPSIWRNRRLPETRFLTAWVVPGWIVFELVPTKLPHYTLPLYPALALLAAQWLLAASPQPRLLGRAACVIAIIVAALLGLAAACLPVVAAGFGGAIMLGLPALAVASGLVVLLIRAWPDPRRAALTMLAATPFLYAAVLGIELPNLRALWIAPQVAADLRRHLPAATGFGALGYAEPSLMFLCGMNTQFLANPADAAQFLRADPNHVLAVAATSLDALAARVPLRPFATVSGYNYSRGRRVRLVLVTEVNKAEGSALDPLGPAAPDPVP